MPEFVDTSPPGVCIFCKLVAGEIPSSRVYEDALTLAFMDLGQLNPGHVLVATKRHCDDLFDLTHEECAAVMQTSQRIARAAQKAFAPTGMTLLQANGRDGGQTVNHFHIHVVPRHPNDGVGLIWPRKEPGPRPWSATRCNCARCWGVEKSSNVINHVLINLCFYGMIDVIFSLL